MFLMNTKKTPLEQNYSDEELFVKSLKNPELFTLIYDRYKEAFIKKARYILKSEDDAYDATQEAFVRIYAAARQYRKLDGATFKSWAYKILINQCFTMYQKNKKEMERGILMDDELHDYLPDQYEIESYNKKLTKDYLMSLVSRLPALLRRIVDLHFIQDIPQKDIAEMEGVSNEVVRSRVHRAKKELKKVGEALDL